MNSRKNLVDASLCCCFFSLSLCRSSSTFLALWSVFQRRETNAARAAGQSSLCRWRRCSGADTAAFGGKEGSFKSRLFNFVLFFFPARKKKSCFSLLIFSAALQLTDMSLLLTVLDKLAYFLSVVACCVSLSSSWLKSN